MPFGDGFDFLDLSTYDWMEYTILGAGLFILILLLVVWPIAASRKGKKSNKNTSNAKQETAVGGKKRLVYKAANGESVLFAGPNAWHINNQGKTELLKAVEGENVNFSGKVIYLAKDVKRVQVIQDGDEITKNSTFEKQFITFDFVSSQEVRLGNKVFLTDKEIEVREVLQAKADAKEAKEQAKADKKAAIAQRKADKKLAKAEAKAAVAQAKADKKSAKKQNKKSDTE